MSSSQQRWDGIDRREKQEPSEAPDWVGTILGEVRHTREMSEKGQETICTSVKGLHDDLRLVKDELKIMNGRVRENEVSIAVIKGEHLGEGGSKTYGLLIMLVFISLVGTAAGIIFQVINVVRTLPK